jgi:hypothetical protein
MANYAESTPETDRACLGPFTAWSIYLPPSRLQEIGKIVGIEGVYCVGITASANELRERKKKWDHHTKNKYAVDIARHMRDNPRKRVFLQLSEAGLTADLDPRNGKVKYVEVIGDAAKQVVDIAYRKMTKGEIAESAQDERRRMELLKAGMKPDDNALNIR